MTTAKCCGLCGRWGTHGYREADSSDRPGYSTVRDGQWVCSNDRACRKRQERFIRQIDRASSFNAGEAP